MAAVFKPSATLVGRAGLLVLGLIGAAAVAWWWIWPRTGWARRVDYYVDQPVPFSHQHHVAGLGIDCRFCHASVELSSNAGMPPTWTCMTCHSQIWTNAALLAPVRGSLAHNVPIAWSRVYDLPDYVYFDHSIHIAKGVGCSSCHGDVAAMPLMRKAVSLTMKFCLDCHRDPGPRLRPASEIYNTEWHRTEATPSPAALMQQYGVPSRKLTDCSICHH
ncbi:MAG: cytochrome c3 family protein [Acetobacteraceae bacterium]|nr:cytochrome c3 family protein [Acetobacteraceae bacterium]